MTKKKLPFLPERKTISEILFSNYKFRVPRFQRQYSWGEDQIQDFWDDIINHTDPYFIGSFVFNFENIKESSDREQGYIDIIDGQQRILTISLFLASLRNICKEKKYLSLADKIQRHTLGFEDPIEDKTASRIQCGDSIHDFYITNIQKENSNIFTVDTKSKEEKQMKDNCLFFKEKIEAELKPNDSEYNEKILKNFYSKIREIITVQIRIENEDDAFEIFETLNARGIDLTLGDLLKNLIFRENIGKENVEERWEEIVKNISDSNTDLAKFIRYHWLSKYSFLTGKKIFRKIKKTINDYDQFLDELVDSSRYYKNFIESSIDDWNDFYKGEELFDSIKSIDVMNVSQCYVLFLSLIRNFEKIKKKCLDFFILVENFSFIYFFISKMPGNKVERQYSKIALEIEKAVKLPEGQILTKINKIYDDLKSKLNEFKPDFELFDEKFNNIEYKDSIKAREEIRYILSKINNFDSTGEHKIDFKNVNIEHILPRKPDQWGLTKKQVKSYVNKLGNLTLLLKKINSDIDNKPLLEKLPELSKSEINMTKQLVEKLKKQKKWEKGDIEKRHIEFSKKSYYEVWNYK